jgi:hypothetical protein
MVGLARRVGIAIGSLVAATLCVGLVGGGLMWFTATAPSLGTWSVSTVVSLVLGGLIYRDILRREQRVPSPPG